MAVSRLSALTGPFSGTGATVAATLPTGIPDNNNAYALIFAQSGNGADPTPPTGWTLHGSIGIGTSGTDVNATKLCVYGKAVGSADSGASVNVPRINGHVICRAGVWLNVDQTTPVTLSTGKTQTPAAAGHSTNSIAQKTGDSQDTFLAVYGDDRDSATASGVASSAWTGITSANTNGTQSNASSSTNLAGGGGIIVIEGFPSGESSAAVSHSFAATSSIWTSLLVRLNATVLPADRARATFNFSDSTTNAYLTGTHITSASMSDGGLGSFGVTTALAPNYPNSPLLQVSAASGATSPANAIANNSYFDINLTGSGNVIRIRFDAAKGGATSNRGFAIRSSIDGFASDVGADLDLDSVRPTQTRYDFDGLNLSLAGGLTLRFYFHTPGTASTIELDDIMITVEQTATAIVPQDSSHGVSSDQATLTPKSAVTSNDSAHGVSSDNAAVSLPAVAVTAQDSSHALSSDQSTVSFVAGVVPNDSSHAVSSDASTVTPKSVVTANDSAHGVSSDQGTVTPRFALTPADSSHGVTSDGATITPKSNVAANDSSHATTSDAATVSAKSVLTPQDSSHGVSSDNATVSVSLTVVPQDSAHAVTSDAGTISTQSAVSVNDSSHGVSSDQGTVTPRVSLTAGDSLHSLTSDVATVAFAAAIAAGDSTHALSSDNATVSLLLAITVGESGHGVSSDQATISAEAAVAINDSGHSVGSDQAVVVTSGTIVGNDSGHSLSSDNATIGFATSLTATDSAHALTSDPSSILFKVGVIPADSLHSLGSDQATINFTAASDVVQGQDSAHSVTSDAASVVAKFGLVPQDSTHGVSSDAATIDAHAAISVDDSAHGISSDESQLVAKFLLAADDAGHTLTSDVAQLISAVSITADEVVHTVSSDEVTWTVVEAIGDNYLTAPRRPDPLEPMVFGNLRGPANERLLVAPTKGDLR